MRARELVTGVAIAATIAACGSNTPTTEPTPAAPQVSATSVMGITIIIVRSDGVQIVATGVTDPRTTPPTGSVLVRDGWGYFIHADGTVLCQKLHSTEKMKGSWTQQ